MSNDIFMSRMHVEKHGSWRWPHPVAAGLGESRVASFPGVQSKSIENLMDWKILKNHGQNQMKNRMKAWHILTYLDIKHHKTAAERSKSLSTCSKSCMDQSIKTDSENRLCSSGVSVTWLRKGSWQHRGLGIVPSDCSLPKPEIL